MKVIGAISRSIIGAGRMDFKHLECVWGKREVKMSPPLQNTHAGRRNTIWTRTRNGLMAINCDNGAKAIQRWDQTNVDPTSLQFRGSFYSVVDNIFWNPAIPTPYWKPKTIWLQDRRFITPETLSVQIVFRIGSWLCLGRYTFPPSNLKFTTECLRHHWQNHMALYH